MVAGLNPVEDPQSAIYNPQCEGPDGADGDGGLGALVQRRLRQQ
jgi:hypothetical protein